MLVTMLAVDVVLGFLGKTMPQMNVITAGLAALGAAAEPDGPGDGGHQ